MGALSDMRAEPGLGSVLALLKIISVKCARGYYDGDSTDEGCL